MTTNNAFIYTHSTVLHNHHQSEHFRDLPEISDQEGFTSCTYCYWRRVVERLVVEGNEGEVEHIVAIGYQAVGPGVA